VTQPRPKPFCISKHDVVEAWKRVKANQGAAGVDEESLRDFERKLPLLHPINTEELPSYERLLGCAGYQRKSFHALAAKAGADDADGVAKDAWRELGFLSRKSGY